VFVIVVSALYYGSSLEIKDFLEVLLKNRVYHVPMMFFVKLGQEYRVLLALNFPPLVAQKAADVLASP